MKVPCDEGLANHIGPESCAGSREAVGEALTGERVGQLLSGERLHIRSADAFQSAEGNTGGALRWTWTRSPTGCCAATMRTCMAVGWMTACL